MEENKEIKKEDNKKEIKNEENKEIKKEDNKKEIKKEENKEENKKVKIEDKKEDKLIKKEKSEVKKEDNKEAVIKKEDKNQNKLKKELKEETIKKEEPKKEIKKAKIELKLNDEDLDLDTKEEEEEEKNKKAKIINEKENKKEFKNIKIKANKKEKFPSAKNIKNITIKYEEPKREKEEIYDSSEDEEYLEETLGIKKVNPIIKGLDEIEEDNLNKEKENQINKNITNEEEKKKNKKEDKNFKRNEKRTLSSQITDPYNIRNNILVPIIEDNEEDINSSSSFISEEEAKNNMENNLNNQKRKYNEKEEKKEKLFKEKKSSFSQTDLLKKEIQEKLFFEKKNTLKKNETKTLPLKRSSKVEFSPKLTAITEIQSPQKLIPDFKVEEEDIDFNMEGKSKKKEKTLFKSFKSSRELKVGKNGFELLDKKGNKFYRVMTINPEKEVELAFFLEKTEGMPIGIYYISGNISLLGEWDTKNALRMKTVKRNGKKFYFNSIILKKNNFPVEYKFFAKSRGEIIWIGKAFDNYIASEEVFTFISEMRFKKNSILLFNTYSTSEKLNYDNSWENRKDYIIPFIYKAGSDIIFFQEINKLKYHYLHHRIDAIYEFIGVDRDEVEDTQHNLIAYNKNKYTLNDWGNFWLSSTPGVPDSNDFHNNFPRNCIWTSLRKVDDYSCLFFNVDFDKNNYNNYNAMVKILLQQIKKVLSKHKDENFVFLGGSFYVEENDPVIQSITQFGFKLIQFESNYHGLNNENKTYDYLFYLDKVNQFMCNQAITFKEESIISKSKNSFISDHFPIKIEFMNNYMKSFIES